MNIKKHNIKAKLSFELLVLIAVLCSFTTPSYAVFDVGPYNQNPDSTLNMWPIVGTPEKLLGSAVFAAPIERIGTFEMICHVSHMANDDPIVFANQPGVAHHHTFFGNTSVNYQSDLTNLANVGNSTCIGGIANRSAYWFPSLVDTATHKPLVPDSSIFYYKSPLLNGNTVTPFPPGFRMIAGNSKAITATENPNVEFFCTRVQAGINNGNYSTVLNTVGKAVPSCLQGDKLVLVIFFPSCSTGELDSDDHKSHVAYRIIDNIATGKWHCPSTHPILLPTLTLQVKYKVTSELGGTQNVRLSSDNYPQDGYNAGYSFHGDFVNGWNQEVLTTLVNNCLNKSIQCRSSLAENAGTTTPSTTLAPLPYNATVPKK